MIDMINKKHKTSKFQKKFYKNSKVQKKFKKFKMFERWFCLTKNFEPLETDPRDILNICIYFF